MTPEMEQVLVDCEVSKSTARMACLLAEEARARLAAYGIQARSISNKLRNHSESTNSDGEFRDSEGIPAG